LKKCKSRPYLYLAIHFIIIRICFYSVLVVYFRYVYVCIRCWLCIIDDFVFIECLAVHLRWGYVHEQGGDGAVSIPNVRQGRQWLYWWGGAQVSEHSYFSGPQGSWSVHVCCLHLKMEFRSCARGRHWCDIIHYYWWTAAIKPRLLFSPADYAEGFSFYQFNTDVVD